MKFWRNVLALLYLCGVAGCATIERRFDEELAACSKNQTVPATESNASFKNTSSATVGVYWVKVYSGDFEKYFELSPGEARKQATFVGHLWVVRKKNGDTVLSRCIGSTDESIVF
jgi:hypothetical protein